MQICNRWIIILLSITAIPLITACRSEAILIQEKPAHVEDIVGSELKRVTLTPKAAIRIDLQTSTVMEENGPGSQRFVPYASLIYDAHARTWVYTSTEPYSFVRHEIAVDRVEGDRVFISDGPAAGMTVTTVGTAELYGTEYDMGH